MRAAPAEPDGWTTPVLFVLAGLAILAPAAAGVAWSVRDPDSDLVIVLAPPWNGGAEAVVARAGARLVGFSTSPLSVLATGSSVQALRNSGAWAVLASDQPGFLCLERARP